MRVKHYMANNNSEDVAAILYDKKSQRTYRRCHLLGKGGFAKCYEIVDVSTNCDYACKVICKRLISKYKQRDKIEQEMSIHRSLEHPNIVRFYNAFEDDDHIYLVLELCKFRSMMDLHKQRKILTEYECRYYIHQILRGVKYLHEHQIVHRDLKLSNIFLNEQLQVKIGDFGLATRIVYVGERKRNQCGTPNYLAPEMLSNKGHSYEVDIWAIGCIMYTLLHGQLPFESKSVRQTYRRIRNCDYQIVGELQKPTVNMLASMLQLNPKNRPTVGELLNCTFMKEGMLIPKSLPKYCLTVSPYLQLNLPILQSVQHKILNALKVIKPYAILVHSQRNPQLVDCLRNRELTNLALLPKKKNFLTNILNEKQQPLLVQQPVLILTEWLDTNGLNITFHVLKRDHEFIGILFQHKTKSMNVSSKLIETKTCSLSMKRLPFKNFGICSHQHLFDIPLFRKIFFTPNLGLKYRSACSLIIYVTNGSTKSRKFIHCMKITVSSKCPSFNSLSQTLTKEDKCTEGKSAAITAVLMQSGIIYTLYNMISYIFMKFKRIFMK